MQIVTFTQREKAELLDHDDATRAPLGPDEVAGPTLVSLISPGTELNGQYLGDRFPAEPGYASVFRVDQLGDEVTDLEPGDVVFCTGPGGIGGHRSRQRCPRQAAIPVPEGLDPAVAAHARLINVTMSTLTSTAARPPARVLITGLGPVGHLGAQLFAACGYEVHAIDPVASRRDLLKAKGIDRVYETAPRDDKSLAGTFKLALECSGHEAGTLDALWMLGRGGECVQVGVPHRPRTDITAHELMHRVFRGFLTYRCGSEWHIPRHPDGIHAGSVFTNLAGALDLLADGRIDVGGLYDVEAPTDPQAVYQRLLQNPGDKLSVVFNWR